MGLQYPESRRGDVVDDYHGTLVPDPYRWLEDSDTPETRAWIEADMRQAVSLGVTGDAAGLPAVFVNGARVAGLVDYERLRLAVLAASAQR